MKVGLEPSKINFIKHKGYTFFERFVAQDKFKTPVRVGFSEYDEFTSLKAYNQQNKPIGFYDILFKKEERSLIGSQLLVEDEGKNIGQLLTLSSLITMVRNNLNHFKLYSVKDAIPFHTRLGFIIQSEDPYYITHGLKQVIKSKAPNIEEFQYKAKFFYPQVKEADPYSVEDEAIFKRGCKVLSDFMAYLGRRKMTKEMPILENGCRMDYSDWDVHINRKFLNSLTKHHNIDYQF